MRKMIRTRDMDWKQWNLRIPLVLFLFGATAALYQSFPNLFLVESGFFVSALYIGGIVLLFMLFEKIGLNQRKIHFTFGILLILTGLLMDISLFDSKNYLNSLQGCSTNGWFT